MDKCILEYNIRKIYYWLLKHESTRSPLFIQQLGWQSLKTAILGTLISTWTHTEEEDDKGKRGDIYNKNFDCSTLHYRFQWVLDGDKRRSNDLPFYEKWIKVIWEINAQPSPTVIIISWESHLPILYVSALLYNNHEFLGPQFHANYMALRFSRNSIRCKLRALKEIKKQIILVQIYFSTHTEIDYFGLRCPSVTRTSSSRN